MTYNERVKLLSDIMTLQPGLTEYLNSVGFFHKPASINHHGNYTGGLFDHSYSVANTLKELTNSLDLKWQRPESPVIVGMFHDLCKCDDYIDANFSGSVMMGTGTPVSGTPKWEKNTSPMFKGHGEKSVMMLSTVMTITPEESACIAYHMGAYDTSGWEYYDRAIEAFSNVLWTHSADMYVSKILGV